MINKDKWISSLPPNNSKFIKEIDQLNYDKWVNTIPKKNLHHSAKKYSLMLVLFVSGLLLVSAVKNETRKLQKEINNLEVSINSIKFNLSQAILDNEVITSPENISKLAKEYLNDDLVSYKRSQIKNLNFKTKKFAKINTTKDRDTNKEKVKNLSKSVKSELPNRI